MKMDLTKFKKVSSDGKSTIMRHADGHEMKICHAALSPKLREQLVAMPAHEEHNTGKINSKKMSDGGVASNSDYGSGQYGRDPKQRKQSGADSRKDSEKETNDASVENAAKSAWKGAKEAFGFSQGGEVDKGPKIDPEGAKAVEKGATESGWRPDTWVDNIKKAISPSPTPKKYDEGSNEGTISATSQDGGQPANMSGSQQPQAPVTINIGTPQSVQTPPAAMINPNPGSLHAAQNPPIGQAPVDAGSLPYGVSPEAVQPQSQSQEQPQQAPVAPGNQQQPPVASGMQDPYGSEASIGAFNKGITQQFQGINREAAANTEIAKQNQVAQQQAVAQQQEALKSFKDNTDSLMNERNQFTKEIQNNMIDPNHYWQNHSKLGSAIGLILGGFNFSADGSNKALDFLKYQMDKDLEAQKANQDTRQTLLRANMEQFKNSRDALDMTRVMQNDIVGHEMSKIAASQGGPLAVARAEQIKGQLNAQNAQLIGQMAMRRTILGAAQSGKADPALVIKAYVPEGQQAAAYKDLKEAQDTAAFRDMAISAFDKLNKIDTIGNRAAHAGFTPPQVKAIREPLLAALSKGTAGRFTEADSEMLAPLLSPAGKSAETVKVQREQLNALLSEKMHFPSLKAIGIDADKLGRVRSNGQTAIPESAPVQKGR